MPKKSRGTPSEKVVVVSGRDIVPSNLVAGALSFPIVPINFNRTATVCDVFEMYRFTSLTCRAIPNAAPTGPLVFGATPGVVSNVPSTRAQAFDMSVSAYVPLGTIAQYAQYARLNNQISLGRKFLITDSANKWWKTQQSAGSPPDWDAVQAAIYFVGNATDSFDLLFTYTCEFTGPLNASNTPLPNLGALNKINTMTADELTALRKIIKSRMCELSLTPKS